MHDWALATSAGLAILPSWLRTGQGSRGLHDEPRGRLTTAMISVEGACVWGQTCLSACRLLDGQKVVLVHLGFLGNVGGDKGF